ncbi:MAG: class III signal peptide-containing protein [Euryarchaeota archaeon]|uniref:class III signal peptide-containing protein n=1 Tax=Methanobacterium sp. MZD130B TaxID=3394378 RepID=UPI001752E05B|nr:class III signal peptide-containing protein [Euryarchaeota archaeon]HHT17969.1 class III signal peptide-containing protein [Methanobacterium sp.]
MNIIKDERGQGAAEYILLFGGVIVMAIAALLIYQAYFETGAGINSETDLSSVRASVNQSYNRG